MAKTNSKSKTQAARKGAMGTATAKRAGAQPARTATRTAAKSRTTSTAKSTAATASKPRKRFVRKREVPGELDGVYLLKLVMILVVGSIWIRFVGEGHRYQIPIPVGLLVGLVFVMRERYRVDRKIDYALLLLAMFVGFWTQVGIYITI